MGLAERRALLFFESKLNFMGDILKPSPEQPEFVAEEKPRGNREVSKDQIFAAISKIKETNPGKAQEIEEAYYDSVQISSAAGIPMSEYQKYLIVRYPELRAALKD